MKRITTWFAAMLTVLSASADIPQPEITEGVWHVPLRYWAHLSPVLEGTGGFDFLCEVEELDSDVPKDQGPPLRFKTGKLKVVELLSGDTEKFPLLKTLKALRVEGCEGFQIGDQVIVFVDGEPYEGGYVIDHHRGTNCIIGHRLARKADYEFEHEFDARKQAESELIRLIKEGRIYDPEATADELRILSVMDPDGVRERLIREIEMGQLVRERSRAEDGTNQSADAPDSNSDSKEKPKPELESEAEVRSR